jgi:hypothetical protein
MIISDPTSREWKRFEKARNQPCLPQTPFVMQDELDHIKHRHFPEVKISVCCCFVDYGHLACICHGEGKEAHIYVHEVLNHSETPLLIAEFVSKHELLHLDVPPREVEGKMTDHPPEFWNREQVLCPERHMAWAWIWRNFYDCLRVDRKKEGIRVLRDWREAAYRPRIPLSRIDPADYTAETQVL